ncbi:60S ribosomal protein L9 [Capsaspora owczarzaki ATCC 30864]|uniref:60S ribosomal protein L9 n=1 Tax=Capsaspora owczarzaki (strain ATCC 30864) TaxID=595528 RepID=A0A0D2U6V9_CAPO3|nr:60S ribosomal protein L9 [Capsaspora owczarzaki ATCC 30864]KJE90906.1 60S ribosomal protein L9 [Capsaspora owczarzaki ATCC 30864]|eukprot:XP_004348888.1 60S ribosomal protein L9 [Capsaspora owczarzaki ATCC 30864]
MRQILQTSYVDIPENVKVAVKARNVKVTGPRGALEREFKHLNVEMHMLNAGRRVRVDMWFGNRKELACVRTLTSHINNMIKGVTEGFEYKMKFVYAHFPINVNVIENKTKMEIRNFIGEKVVRTVAMIPGVTVEQQENVKDEIVLRGNSVEDVSLSAAVIQQSVKVHNKDIRKFLDGIYVSSTGSISVKGK